MIQEKTKKKKLSKEVQEAISEVTKRELSKELNYLKGDLADIVIDNIHSIKLKVRKESIEDKEAMTEYILKKYKPLKKEIETIEKTLLNPQIIEEEKRKSFENLMVVQFKENDTEYEEKLNLYRSLKQVWKFIDMTLEEYKKELEEDIEQNEKLYREKSDQRIYDKINRDNKKIYILEEFYKKGVSAKKIKYDKYENERRFLYDKNELLNDLYPRFTFIYTIIDLF